MIIWKQNLYKVKCSIIWVGIGKDRVALIKDLINARVCTWNESEFESEMGVTLNLKQKLIKLKV